MSIFVLKEVSDKVLGELAKKLAHLFGEDENFLKSILRNTPIILFDDIDSHEAKILKKKLKIKGVKYDITDDKKVLEEYHAVKWNKKPEFRLTEEKEVKAEKEGPVKKPARRKKKKIRPGKKFQVGSKIAQFVNSFASKKEKYLTGIDFDSLFIRLVQTEETPRGKKVVKLAVKRKEKEKDLKDQIKEILEEEKVKADFVISSIPRHRTTIRYLELPSIIDDELGDMVGLQIIKHIPYSRDEVVFDHQMFERTSEGFGKVQVAVVHRDVVSDQINLLEGIGLKVERLALSSQAIFNSYRAVSARLGVKETGLVCLINIDYENSEIEMVKGNNLIYSRSVAYGVKDLVGEGEVVAKAYDEFTLEVEKTFSTFQKDKIAVDTKIDKIVLLGPMRFLEGIKNTIAKEIGIPIEIVSFLDYLPLSAKINKEELKTVECSFSPTVGLVLGLSKKREYNLIPNEVKEKIAFQLRKKDLVRVGISLGIVLVLAAGVYFKEILDKKSYLAAINMRIRETRSRAREVEAMIEQVKAVKSQMDMEGSSLDVLREVYGLAPKGVSLSLFSYDEEEVAVVRGFSKTMAGVFTFKDKLEKSAYFSNVEVKYARNVGVRGMDVAEFEIHCPISKKSRRRKKE